MSNCLITKLKGTVNNERLLKLGETFFTFDKKAEGSLSFSTDVTLSCVGCHFSDSTYTQDNGKTMTIGTNKKQLFLVAEEGESTPIVKFDKSNLKSYECLDFYSPVHDAIYVGSQLEVYNSKAYDNKEIPLEDFCANKVMLHHINCNANFTGDIANFAKVPGIQSIVCTSENIYGDISSFKNVSDFTSISVPNITGDLSTLGINFKTISSKLPLSWKNERSSESLIISITGGNDFGGDLDNMLINQAKCKKAENYWEYRISVKGNRTAASDGAITTLQQKGYTVSILQ